MTDDVAVSLDVVILHYFDSAKGGVVGSHLDDTRRCSHVLRIAYYLVTCRLGSGGVVSPFGDAPLYLALDDGVIGSNLTMILHYRSVLFVVLLYLIVMMLHSFLFDC